MTIDFDKPVRAIGLLSGDPVIPAEILRANLKPPFIAVGLIFTPAVAPAKGVDPLVVLIDAEGKTSTGYQLENFEPTVAGYTPRSLRVGEHDRYFKTKSGVEAVFMGPNGVDLDFEILYPGRESAAYVTTDAAGRVVEPRPQNADELDIVEVNQPVTRYVKIYDKPKTAKNPSCCTNWYEFDSLAEAQANMQGVRAIVPVTYTEGDNFP